MSAQKLLIDSGLFVVLFRDDVLHLEVQHIQLTIGSKCKKYILNFAHNLSFMTWKSKSHFTLLLTSNLSYQTTQRYVFSAIGHHKWTRDNDGGGDDVIAPAVT